MEDLLQIGAIATTHGVRGEVKVFPMTDDVNRFKILKSTILKSKNEEIELEIRSVKFFKNMVILGFKGYDNINDIEKYKGCGLYVTRENAVELEDGEYFRADLIDLDIYNEDEEKIGVLTDILETGANDVYIINLDDGRELLLPNTDECVLDIDLEKNKMTIHILEGLLD